MTSESYSERLRRLLRRYNPVGVLISDRKVYAALETLRSTNASEKQLDYARWVCDTAMHPVLQQPIPSAFRLSAFAPVTALLALGMVSNKSPLGLVFYHWLYQSHSAGTRYCNYADTSRPLDSKRMLTAYAVSTGAACSIALGALAAVKRAPRLQPIGLVVPHLAVCVAGAASTVLNNEQDLLHGVQVTDASGRSLGVSRHAAREGVERAVLLQSLLVPTCALLVPVLTMRTLVVPRLMHTNPLMLWPTSAALVLGGVCGLTPAAAAAVPRHVTLPRERVEPELQALVDEGGRPVQEFHSTRVLY